MEKQITYGTMIHYDGTIAKYDCWTFENEEEFWIHYDLHVVGKRNISADLQKFTITNSTYITVEEYREAKDTIGEEE
jgi:hypothetical protein|tara:strand:- start:172 stop:402 length:231 start_codon:yes stop_codon:yes gene_type:complete